MPNRFRAPATASLLVASAACLLTASCQSDGGLGRFPRSLVELYDQAAPNGGIELELDRNGVVREMEAEIPIADLPDGVRAAALAELPAAEILGAERELSARSDAFEVKLRHDDRVYELVIDRDGKVLESEKSLRPVEYPTEVVQAAHAAFPEGTLESVEVIQIGKETQYHVKKRKDGASYKIVLRHTAELIRVVREARAEIEIPLRD